MGVRDIALVANAVRQYQNLGANDQRALGVLALALVCGLLYFAVWKPSAVFYDHAIADYATGQKLVETVKLNEALLRQLAQNGATGSAALAPGQSLVSVVSGSARPFNLQVKRVEPSGEQKVRVWLEKVEFNQTLKWLESLKGRYHISVADVQIDKEEAAGIVSARFTLQI
ncbi:MAG: type II secretion system protein M [Hahellaceae bacterium]|nr:type II secretion system protein M [Hahellaceae bacterium]MCP5170401.1 type II secretion system protein M [Hahellaceae bacterium]